MDDVIALGRGDPDFHTPPHIVEAAKRALDQNQHHYTHPAGLPVLREAIAGSLAADFGLRYGADEIIVTAGVQESIMLCMLGTRESGRRGADYLAPLHHVRYGGAHVWGRAGARTYL